MTNKLGVVLASAAAVAFLAVTGCASQQSAAPATADSNVATANACKGKSACKQMTKKHHKAAAKADTTTSSADSKTTTTSTDTAAK